MVRLLTNIYNGLINAVDKIVPNKLKPMWVSPVGPRTVFFWAPVLKWVSFTNVEYEIYI